MFSDHPLPPPPPMLERPPPPQKPPVVRGARACTVCRLAKMKCVGGEEGVKPCQRCKRSGADCIFEKHRRGRKPGSKLSEASRVLRHLEKGLPGAKAKVDPTCTSQSPVAEQDSHLSIGRFPNNELPPLKIPPDFELPLPRASDPTSSRMPIDFDQDQDEKKPESETMYPANLIRREGERSSSFFKTILNPQPEAPSIRFKESSSPSPQLHSPVVPLTSSINVTVASELRDPIEAGFIDEKQADTLFQLLFLRLNPFINLFDPHLHTVPYVRNRSRFLFSTLIMACCKFFKPEFYPQAQKIANEFAVRAFADGQKSVEVAQAFACMTYWKEPEDTRTFSYIGYACRMAVELGLNTLVRRRPLDESDYQLLERRNRERTYLVLFVHDRSLSVQTGRLWMLPEDDFIRHSVSWHSDHPMAPRPEDTIIAAFTQLQRIASDTTDTFNAQKDNPPAHIDGHNHDALLRTCNGRLTQWMDTWHHEMRRAAGDKFHMAFLNIFRLHVRLFLNSFGIQSAMASSSKAVLNLQALSACYNSAIEILQIVVDDFAAPSMLRHAQESITVMTAYAAVFLLKLLRSPNTMSQLHEGATDEIYTHISRVAEAYDQISRLSEVMTSAAHHARFLRGLVEHDIARSKQMEQQRRQQQQASADYYRRNAASSSSGSSDLYRYPSSGAAGTTRLPPVQVALSSAYMHRSGESDPSPSSQGQAESNLPPLHSQARNASSDASGSGDSTMGEGSESAYRTNMLKNLGYKDDLYLPPPSASMSSSTASTSNATAGPSYGDRYPAASSSNMARSSGYTHDGRGGYGYSSQANDYSRHSQYGGF
ncbi:unnamed protein product [Somion occarium]|uniref:Zn(2)-C6 fungal-type domain-containing protein n=2 Tax=Somion occarium TaxID=3059160 RepID=A0ABP1DHK0_9APHY